MYRPRVHPPLPAIPGLTLLRPLGRGGFGTVHLARQDRLARDVAVKLDNRVLPGDRDRERFLREARAAARLSGHPNVVNVYDAGVTEDGRPYIAMELCTGGSLSDLLAERGPLPAARVAEIGAELAGALAHAHDSGILHRDIKPANVLVNAFGAVKLADFGLAAILDAHAESTVTVGALSPHYAAPEVFAHTAPSPAGDVYSLAATLHALLTGRGPRDIPWPADSLDDLVSALRAPVRPVEGAPDALNAALLAALDADPARRTASAARLRDELSGLRPPPPLPRAATTRGRTGGVVLAAALVPALVAGGFFLRGALAPGVSGAAATHPPATAPPSMTACPGHEEDGFCVAEKCFSGMVTIAGVEARANPVPCAEPHAWQAFSGAWLPDSAAELPLAGMAEVPEVARSCSRRVMDARIAPSAPRDEVAGWRIEVLPSARRDHVHCVAGPAGGRTSGSAFASG